MLIIRAYVNNIDSSINFVVVCYLRISQEFYVIVYILLVRVHDVLVLLLLGKYRLNTALLCLQLFESAGKPQGSV